MYTPLRDIVEHGQRLAAPILWKRFQQHLSRVSALELTLDVSRMQFDDGFLYRMAGPMKRSFEAMDALERGAIANPDEFRRVGHYWLRAPELAPSPEIAGETRKAVVEVKAFAAAVHCGAIRTPAETRFARELSIGIGGSALGPMFVADALGNPSGDRMEIDFIDNTDPDGIARILEGLTGRLGETLCIVTSKSGGTPDTRNGMLLVADAYRDAGLELSRHAVAITMPGSELDRTALEEGWLARCDEATRRHDLRHNPGALMALMWYHAAGGNGRKDMVVLPYKDRLLLFSRYLQQLVMESLGKRLNLNGERVDQGIAVYGNKGSTDQHAYVQQLRDGVNNFFVTFVRVLESGGSAHEVEPGVTAGDYLHGFLLGTREALFENGRQSMTITIPRVDARTVGGLIALFERAVGLYANLIGINAYHQPGVEAGKKAAASILALQGKVLAALSAAPQTAEEVAAAAGVTDSAETVCLLLEHLAANGRARSDGAGIAAQMTFRKR